MTLTFSLSLTLSFQLTNSLFYHFLNSPGLKRRGLSLTWLEEIAGMIFFKWQIITRHTNVHTAALYNCTHLPTHKNNVSRIFVHISRMRFCNLTVQPIVHPRLENQQLADYNAASGWIVHDRDSSQNWEISTPPVVTCCFSHELTDIRNLWLTADEDGVRLRGGEDGCWAHLTLHQPGC